MKLSLPRFLKREKAEAPVAVATPAAPPPAPKAPSERLSKTVLPNMARVMEPDAALASDGNIPVPGAPRAASSGQAAPAFSLPRIGRAENAETATERTISLLLGDIIPQIPGELVQATEIDPDRQIAIRAAELERGMASGRPVVPLHLIYTQVPEIFGSKISPNDEREVALPFQKVLEQFANMQVRDDQVPEEAVPQVETPFSLVTTEDSVRFGTAPASVAPQTRKRVAMPTLEKEPASAPTPVAKVAPTIAPAPVVKVAPAPVSVPAPSLQPSPASAPQPPPVAKNISFSSTPDESASPAATAPAPSAPLPPIRLPKPLPQIAPSAPAPAPAAPVARAAAAEDRPASAPVVKLPSLPAPPATPPPLKVRFSPNGTDAPATERVPASSGPSVPTPLPAPFAPPPPARIPFKVTPPASDLCPPPPLQPAAPVAASAPRAFSESGPRLRLSLRAVARELPPFQFSGTCDAIPESAGIELPFAIVEPQLALGRVAISPAQFHAAMPEEFRSLFVLDDAGTPVSLPLPEVLQNLPNESLQLRQDQEESEVTEVFETPFSQKAAEDAARLSVPAGPIGKHASEPAAAPAEASAAPIVAAPVRSGLQEIFNTDEPVDAKAVVAHASEIAGVKACAVVFSDGLSLAGNIAPEDGGEAINAIAVEVGKRLQDQMIKANLGPLHGVTLFYEKAPVSFFAQGDICLAAIHANEEVPAGTRQQLGRITRELAPLYSQPLPNA